MKRLALPLALLLALCVTLAGGCGGKKSGIVLLKSEQRLAGMYEACKKIELTDGASKQTINTDELKSVGSVEISAVLKRANGMQKPGKWAGAPLAAVLDSKGVAQPYRELRIEAWDGYVGRVAYDVAVRPDTILADMQDGRPLPREDGPVRLVVGSEDGFYWVTMITKIEVLR